MGRALYLSLSLSACVCSCGEKDVSAESDAERSWEKLPVVEEMLGAEFMHLVDWKGKQYLGEVSVRRALRRAERQQEKEEYDEWQPRHRGRRGQRRFEQEEHGW